MIEKVNTIKAVVTGALAAATALWGWFGWLIIALIVCMMLDYITGSMAAGKNGEWHSRRAWEGIRHKIGCIVAVGATGIADLVIGLILKNIPLALPFTYTVALCPVVVAWYILTELGSIIENAEHLGAPIPPFLRNFLSICKNSVEKTGEALNDKNENPK